ncbi:MAG: hypothetical protein QW835_00205 [Candidatus Hadarchaeum sp.]
MGIYGNSEIFGDGAIYQLDEELEGRQGQRSFSLALQTEALSFPLVPLVLRLETVDLPSLPVGFEVSQSGSPSIPLVFEAGEKFLGELVAVLDVAGTQGFSAPVSCEVDAGSISPLVGVAWLDSQKAGSFSAGLRCDGNRSGSLIGGLEVRVPHFPGFALSTEVEGAVAFFGPLSVAVESWAAGTGTLGTAVGFASPSGAGAVLEVQSVDLSGLVLSMEIGGEGSVSLSLSGAVEFSVSGALGFGLEAMDHPARAVFGGVRLLLDEGRFLSLNALTESFSGGRFPTALELGLAGRPFLDLSLAVSERPPIGSLSPGFKVSDAVAAEVVLRRADGDLFDLPVRWELFSRADIDLFGPVTEGHDLEAVGMIHGGSLRLPPLPGGDYCLVLRDEQGRTIGVTRFFYSPTVHFQSLADVWHQVEFFVEDSGTQEVVREVVFPGGGGGVATRWIRVFAVPLREPPVVRVKLRRKKHFAVRAEPCATRKITLNVERLEDN